MRWIFMALGCVVELSVMAYPTVEEAMAFNRIAETNRAAAYEYAIDLIARCGWNGRQQAGEISRIVGCVITNAFSYRLSLTNEIGVLRDEFCMRRGVLSTPIEFDPQRTLLLSREAVECLACELNRSRAVDLRQELNIQWTSYRSKFPSNDPYVVSADWVPYRNRYLQKMAVAGVLADHRTAILKRGRSYLRAYRDSLSPAEVVAFTNRFISVAGLSTNEVRQVFGE